MKGKIFLTSCGLKEKAESIEFYEYVKPAVAGKRALVITNATSTGHNQRAIAPTMEKLTLAGADVTEVMLDKSNTEIIDSAQLIYVVGGDVSPLLELVFETDFQSKVAAFLDRGGIYIGESAGSIIMGKNAKWYYDIKKNTHERYSLPQKSYKCLGFTDYCIYPHFDKAPETQVREVLEYEVSHGIKITRLKDGEFVEI